MSFGVVGGSTLWYLARATGIVSLVLLTVTVVLGIVTSVRWSTHDTPRFVIEYLHRNVSLLVLVLLGVHVATIVIDGFAPIGWLDAIVPFVSPYRPFWLGLGALALDLLVAIAITSWLRHRIAYRAWKSVHWFAYGVWVVAVVHGFATGTDTKQGWALLVEGVCVAVVVVAAWWRISVGWGSHNAVRIAAAVATLAVPVALFAFLRVGPLAPNWARRSGTPAAVLARTRGTTTTTPASVGSGGGR